MFYYSDLMTNGVLSKPWRKGTQQETRTESSEEIKNICNELSSRLEYEVIDRRRRLSLRTSAVLLSGTARMYREELDNLYTECMELDRSLVYRRRSIHAREDSDSCEGTNESEDSNENDVGLYPNQVTNGNNTANESARYLRSVSNIEDYSNTSNISQRREPRKQKEERGIQTTRSFLAKRRNRRREISTDDLPLGVVMVFEGNSRTPAGVICSSLNSDVRRLYRNI